MKNVVLLGLSCLFMSMVAKADTFAVEGQCDVRFSPKGGAEARLVQYISSAKSSIHVLAYSFTNRAIAQALIVAKSRGVAVEIVLDQSQLTAVGSKLSDVALAGIPVWIDKKHAIAHNKTMIVDVEYFETGSFNYTASAENSNGENAMICKSVQGASVYLADWERHRAHSVRY